MSPKEGFDGFRVAAVPPCQGDVRHESAMLRLEADLLYGALAVGGDRSCRLLRFDARPKRASVSPLEFAHSGDPKCKRRAPDTFESGCDIVCNRPLDLADETQRKMKLLVAGPAQRGTVFHRVDEQVSDVFGGPDCDEEPVHDF